MLQQVTECWQGAQAEATQPTFLLRKFQLYKSCALNEYSGVVSLYEGWNFNSGNYLFTTDTK